MSEIYIFYRKLLHKYISYFGKIYYKNGRTRGEGSAEFRYTPGKVVLML